MIWKINFKRVLLLSVFFFSFLVFAVQPFLNQNPKLLFFIPYSCEYDACSDIIIQGNSMLPTFENGEHALFLSDYYTRFSVEKGEMVGIFFKQTINGPKQYVRRVVAVPGDIVSLDSENRILVNGELVDGGFGFALVNKGKDRFFLYYLEKYQNMVPKDFIVVLGDNRNNSFDSRNFGFIPLSVIAGKVVHAPV
jgi:signal peptidase I